MTRITLPSALPSVPAALDQQDRQLLLDTARVAIEFGLEHRHEMPLRAADYSHAVREARATFVTLRFNRALQGCVGTTRAMRPLISDVAHNAFHAAFSDYRFPPVTQAQLAQLEVHISILSPLVKLEVESEEELLRELRPGIDGLVLEEDEVRATFLPTMWEQLPDVRGFVDALKEKAGFAPHYWSRGLEAFRYTTVTIA